MDYITWERHILDLLGMFRMEKLCENTCTTLPHLVTLVEEPSNILI